MDNPSNAGLERSIAQGGTIALHHTYCQSCLCAKSHRRVWESRGPPPPPVAEPGRTVPQVAQDMIWVWGENGPDAVLESAINPPVLIPELNDEEAIKSGRVTAGSVLQRDLPYAWETFVENVVVSEIMSGKVPVHDCVVLWRSSIGGFSTLVGPLNRAH